ncbi:hypothetical protein ACE1TF_06520 [Geomicrobium sp. JSM 1781026]|uniref:hypothetical protein n=1 Tax=Geomicrobium sp. JSM 1781026 TaxID=3344580 RepID=UPI0035C0930A
MKYKRLYTWLPLSLLFAVCAVGCLDSDEQTEEVIESEVTPVSESFSIHDIDANFSEGYPNGNPLPENPSTFPFLDEGVKHDDTN